MYNYEELKNELKNKSRAFVYYVKPNNDVSLIVKAKDKKEAKKELTNKLKNKEEMPGYFLFLRITFHKGNKPLQGGPLAVLVKTYEFIDGKVKANTSKKYSGLTGPVWFGKDFLEEEGWSYEYLDVIVKLLAKKIFKFSGGITIYEVSILPKKRQL
jgi:hypothetical protein